ncbi:DUF4360 domain-containing protein [Actinomadura chibensis]|uniref:DUF4360 domain-containing protein n=2 Tax=Actinomadura chibensis TaxID=392828 RepID=A0A5D0NP49_9ACTN|nr:DUF4360 domain-containing protein [Actinomadura chibensis]
MMNAKRLAIVLGAGLVVPAVASATAMLATSSAVFAPASATSAADDEPAPAPAVPSAPVTMEVETVNGSGCAAGTAKVTPSGDNTAFTVSYEQYVAWAGGQAPPASFRKNCQLNVKVNAPEGWTYAITGIEHRGFAHLEAGATGLLRANYYFQGDSRSHAVSHDFTGPYNDSWKIQDKIAPADRIYAPCAKERNLNINTELRAAAGDSDAKSSFLAMESNYGNSRYQLVWKRCAE